VHEATVHWVPEHAGVPFCTAQTTPQPPHAFTLFVVTVSQPLVSVASQLPKPAAHVMEHAPPEQDGAPLFALHALPQAPQWDTFVAVLVSQPFAVFPSQFANVPLHEAISQVPVAQVSTAFGRSQIAPQLPQLVSVLRLVSQPSA
jgi:hypothetical protein